MNKNNEKSSVNSTPLSETENEEHGICPFPKFISFFKSPIGIGHTINALYGTAFTIQIAMLPFLVMDIGLPVMFNGYVIGMFSVLQFFGSIAFGRLADYIGPSLALLLSQASSAATYALMAISVNPAMLILSQIPAFFMQGFQAAALLICYETTSVDRTPSIAYLNLSYGIGAVVGGFFAAFVSTFVGPRGALISGCIITILGSILALELEAFEELKPEKIDCPTWNEAFASIHKESLRMWNIILKTLSICFLMTVGLFPVLMTRFSYAPIAVDFYGLTPIGSSYLIAYIGCLTVLAEGLLAPYLASKFGDITCCKASTILTLFGFIFLALNGGNKVLPLIYLILPLCGGALLYVCATSQMTKRVDKSEIGSILGLNGALFYLIAGISPMIAFQVYGLGGIPLYWSVCAVIAAALVIYLFVFDEATYKAFPWDPPPYTFIEATGFFE